MADDFWSQRKAKDEAWRKQEEQKKAQKKPQPATVESTPAVETPQQQRKPFTGPYKPDLTPRFEADTRKETNVATGNRTPKNVEYTAFDGTRRRVVVDNRLPVTKETVDPVIAKDERLYEYGPKTQLPLSVDTDKETADGNIYIGDVDAAEKALYNEFTFALSNYYIEKGKPVDLAWQIAKEMWNAYGTDPDEGLGDSVGRLFQGDWRQDWMGALGVKTDKDRASGGDQFAKDLAESYRSRWLDLHELKGIKAYYGEKIDKKIFEDPNKSAVDDGRQKLYSSLFGWLGKDMQRSIERLTSFTPDERSKGVATDEERKGTASGFWSKTRNDFRALMNGDWNDVSIPSLSEAKRILLGNLGAEESTMQTAVPVDEDGNPDVTFMEKFLPAVGSLAGSLMGPKKGGGYGGALNISSRAIDKASRIVGRVAETPAFQKVLATAPAQKLTTLIGKVPEVKDAARMSATFALAGVIENAPNMTEEELEKSLLSGMVFGATGTFVSERFFYPMMIRASMWQKALQTPGILSRLSPQAIKTLSLAASKQKDAAYLLGNIVANPFQSMAATVATGEFAYDEAQLAVDLVMAPFMSRGALDHIRRQRAEGVLDIDHIRAAAEYAEAEEAWRQAKEYAGVTGKDYEPDTQAQDQKADTEQPTEPQATTIPETGDKAVKDARAYVHADDDVRRVYEKQESRTVRDLPIDEETTVGGILNGLEAEGLSSTQKKAYDAIREIASETKVVIGDTASGGPAEYDAATRTIRISREQASTPEGLRNAILHEGLHDVLFDAVSNNPEVAGQVLKLRDTLANQPWFQTWVRKNPREAAYILDNPHELLAAMIDTQHGIGKEVAKFDGLLGTARSVWNRLLGGKGVDAKEAEQIFSSIINNVQTREKEIRTGARDIDQEVSYLQFVRDSLNDRIENGEMDPDVFRDLEEVEQALAEYDAIRTRMTDEAQETVGMYRHLMKALDYGKADGITRGALDAEMSTFLAKTRRYGLKDEKVFKHLTELFRDEYEFFEDLDPLEKIQFMNSKLPDYLRDPLFVDEVRELEKIPPAPEDVFDNEWMEQPEIAGKQLRAILGVEENGDVHTYLDAGLASPKDLITDFLEKTDTYVANLPENRQKAVKEEARSFIRDYVFSNHNTEPVTPLVMTKNGTAPMKGRRRSPTGKVMRESVQSATAYRRRLNTVLDGMLKAGNDTPWAIINDTHASIAETIRNAKIGVVTDSELISISDAHSAAENLYNTGWYMLPKGRDGNIFLDFSEIVQSKDPNDIRRMTKAVEEMTLLSWLGMERNWGPGEDLGFVRSALAAFDLWKLVDKAQQGDGQAFGPSYDDIKDALTAKVHANTEWKKQAVKKSEDLARAANRVVAKLAEYYAPYDGIRPAILHRAKDADAKAASVAAITAMLHKLVDYGGINYRIEKKPGAFNKNQGKYYGVGTQLAYKKLKDTKTGDALLSASGRNKQYPPLDLTTLQGNERDNAVNEWYDHGVQFRENGTPYVKMFLANDKWAEANPDLARYFFGMDNGKLVAPSENHDGATFLFNKKTHEFLSDLVGKDPEMSTTKWAYAGDFIYKSALSPKFMTDKMQASEPLLWSFLQELKSQGYSGIVLQSAIKSKADRYVRKDLDPGHWLVQDHDGTILGEETIQNGERKFTAWSEEDVLAYYSGELTPANLALEFDITGDNALAYVNSSSSRSKMKAPNLGIDKTMMAVPNYHGTTGKDIQDAVATPTYKKADEFAEVFTGAKTIDHVTENPRAALTEKDLKRQRQFIERLVEKMEKTDPETTNWVDQKTKDDILRALDMALLPDGSVDPAAIVATRTMYPDVFDAYDNDHSLAAHALKESWDEAKRVNTHGKQVKLHPYVPMAHHAIDGIQESLRWVREEARQQDRDPEQAVEEYVQWVNDLTLGKMTDRPIVDETGRLVPYGQGVVLSKNDFAAINRWIAKRRAKTGHDIPFMTVGSKVIFKLTPHDSAASFMPMYLIGVDDSMPTGIMANNEALTKLMGRDFDGDDMGLILESDLWYDEASGQARGDNDFLNLWETLQKEKTYDPASKPDVGDEKSLVDINGQPFKTNVIRHRPQDGSWYRQMLNAQGEGERSIGNGIAKLNSWWEFVRQQGYKDGETVDIVHKGNVFTIKLDLPLLERNDSFYKQAQYDTYTPYRVDPEDVFYNSRVVKSIVGGEEVDGLKPEHRQHFDSAVAHLASRPKGSADKFAGSSEGFDGLLGAHLAIRNRQMRNVYGSNRDAITIYDEVARRSVKEDYVIDDLGEKATKLLDTLLNDYVQSAEKLPEYGRHRFLLRDYSKLGPRQRIAYHIYTREMLQTARPVKDVVGDVVQWKNISSKDYFLTDPDGKPALALRDAINPDGTFHEDIQALMDQGLSFNDIFPPELVSGFVRNGTLPTPANAKDRMQWQIAAFEWAKDNPNSVLIRATRKDTAEEDILFNVNPSVKIVGNFDEAMAAAQQAIAEGKTPVVDTSSGIRKDNDGNYYSIFQGSGMSIYSAGMAHQAMNYGGATDRSRHFMAGVMAGALEKYDQNNNAEFPEMAFKTILDYRINKGNDEKAVVKDPYRLFNMIMGAESTGADIRFPDGTLARTGFFDVIRQNIADRRDGIDRTTTLGMFNGSVKDKIRGITFGRGKASSLNRLNKYVGMDLTKATTEDIFDIQGKVADFLREEYGEKMSDDLLDRSLMAFDPDYFRTLENTTWHELSSLPDGEHYIRAHKAVALIQAMQTVKDMVDNADIRVDKDGKNIKDFWAIWSPWAKQSIEARVNTFATDVMPTTGDTPTHNNYTITIANDRVVGVEARPVLFSTGVNDLDNTPNLVRPVSQSFLRHGYWHRSLNGTKDMFRNDVMNIRKKLGSLFPRDYNTSIPNDVVKETISYLMDPAQAGYLDAHHNAPQLPFAEFSVEFNTVQQPSVAVRIGDKTFVAGADGYFNAEDLTMMADAYLPLRTYQKVDANGNLESGREDMMREVIKLAITAKAQNVRYSAYLDVLAKGLEDYYTGIVDKTGEEGSPEAFMDVTEQVLTTIGELRREAEARRAPLVDHLNAMNYVDHWDFVRLAKDYMQSYREAVQKARDAQRNGEDYDLSPFEDKLVELGQALKLPETTPAAVLSFVRGRMKKHINEDTQMSRTQAFFEREFGQRDDATKMFDGRDAIIMEVLFNQQPEHNIDLLFQHNEDTAQRTINRVNQAMLQTYRREKSARRALGLPVNDNVVAETNMLASFVTDGTIWNRDIPLRGIRSALTTRANEAWKQGRRFLDSTETGIAAGTPVVVSHSLGDTNVISQQGRYLGTVIVPHTVDVSPRLDRAMNENAVAREEVGKVFDDSRDHRTMVVLYNGDNGSISYVDVDSIRTMQTGQRIGRTAQWAESRVAKMLEKQSISGKPLGEFLADGVRSAKLVNLRDNNELYATEMVSGHDRKDIPFFAEIGREAIPDDFASAVHGALNMWSGTFSQWGYLFGKQAFGTALGVASLAVTVPFFGMAGAQASLGVAAYYFGQGTLKFIRNKLQNKYGPVLRGQAVSRTLASGFGRLYGKERGLSGVVSKGLTVDDMGTNMQTPEMATASQRIGGKAGLALESIAPSQASKVRDTWQPNAMYRQMERVKDIVDGWGKYLTEADAKEIQSLIEANVRHAERIEAEIIEGRLSLRSRDDANEILGTYTELGKLNMQALDLLFTAPGKITPLNGVWYGLGSAVKLVNKLRMRVASTVSETEAQTILKAANIANLRSSKLATQRVLEPVDEIERRSMAARSFIETVAGKFDERPVDMMTPSGRLRTLFSQFGRNFFRKTSAGIVAERRFLSELGNAVNYDADFIRAVQTQYGINIGDGIIEGSYAKLTEKGISHMTGPMAVSLATPLILSGLGYAVAMALSQTQYEYWWKRISGELDSVYGFSTAVSQTLSMMASLIGVGAEMADGVSKKEEKKVARSVDKTVDDAIRFLPWGAGDRVGVDIVAKLGLWGAYKSGMGLPYYDGEKMIDELLTTTTPLATPVVGPVSVGVKAVTMIDNETGKRKKRKR